MSHSWDTAGPALSKSAGKTSMVGLVLSRQQTESSIPFLEEPPLKEKACSVLCLCDGESSLATDSKSGDKAEESFAIPWREKKKTEIEIYPRRVGRHFRGGQPW